MNWRLNGDEALERQRRAWEHFHARNARLVDEARLYGVDLHMEKWATRGWWVMVAAWVLPLVLYMLMGGN